MLCFANIIYIKHGPVPYKQLLVEYGHMRPIGAGPLFQAKGGDQVKSFRRGFQEADMPVLFLKNIKQIIQVQFL